MALSVEVTTEDEYVSMVNDQRQDEKVMNQIMSGAVTAELPVPRISFMGCAEAVYGEMAAGHMQGYRTHEFSTRLVEIYEDMMSRTNLQVFSQMVSEQLVAEVDPRVWAYMSVEVDDFTFSKIPAQFVHRLQLHYSGSAGKESEVVHYVGGMPYFMVDWGIPGVDYSGITRHSEEVRRSRQES